MDDVRCTLRGLRGSAWNLAEFTLGHGLKGRPAIDSEQAALKAGTERDW